MSGRPSIAGAPFLADADLGRLLAALGRDGEEARIAGGAVRNALLGAAVTDVDVATTTTPDETVRRAEAEGFRAVPTGIEHGTVTVVAGERAYEVTTLRDDVATDGRRAVVRFGRDWKRDAERRDFTMNALYATADGTVIDLVGGTADIAAGIVLFIGDPDARIREDYLRILRFFRIFAWYGRGRPDADGLRACARLKAGMARLSAERVWQELHKLFLAPDPARAVLWMRQASVLTAVLPETEKWGIDALHAAISAERDFGWRPDPIWRLAGILPPDAARLSALGERLRLPRRDAERLAAFAKEPRIGPETTETALRKRAYLSDAQAIRDRLRLDLALAHAADPVSEKAVQLAALEKALAARSSPPLPVDGDDLRAAGVPQGPVMGDVLRALNLAWIESGFSLGREALLERGRRLASQ